MSPDPKLKTMSYSDAPTGPVKYLFGGMNSSPIVRNKLGENVI